MDIIKVGKRDFTLKAKQLRLSGFVPASVYGGPLADSISLQLDEASARALVRKKREGTKLKLDLDGQLISVQIKEKTLDPLSGEIMHISFQALSEDQKVNSVIHLILKNTDKVLGTLEQMLLEIPYSSLPSDMIDTITIDIEGMKAGSVMTVSDVPELTSDKITLQVKTDEIILRVNEKKQAAQRNTEAEAE